MNHRALYHPGCFNFRGYSIESDWSAFMANHIRIITGIPIDGEIVMIRPIDCARLAHYSSYSASILCIGIAYFTSKYRISGVIIDVA